MVDFSHLRQHEVRAEATTRYHLVQLDGTPWLEIAPATEHNKPYFNETLRRANRSAALLRARGGMTAEMLEATREDDRRLYPKYVIRGWGKVYDRDGAAVPFSEENAAEFVRQLPSWIFDDLRLYAQNPGNFAGMQNHDDSETVSGNSGSASSSS